MSPGFLPLCSLCACLWLFSPHSDLSGSCQHSDGEQSWDGVEMGTKMAPSSLGLLRMGEGRDGGGGLLWVLIQGQAGTLPQVTLSAFQPQSPFW